MELRQSLEKQGSALNRSMEWSHLGCSRQTLERKSASAFSRHVGQPETSVHSTAALDLPARQQPLLEATSSFRLLGFQKGQARDGRTRYPRSPALRLFCNSRQDWRAAPIHRNRHKLNETCLYYAIWTDYFAVLLLANRWCLLYKV